MVRAGERGAAERGANGGAAERGGAGARTALERGRERPSNGGCLVAWCGEPLGDPGAHDGVNLFGGA